jgi:hypothetical protein
MEPAYDVSTGNIVEADTEKRAYRNTRDNATDAPEPLLRPSPATDHDAEILDVEDPDLGYDAENFPYKQPQRGMRPTFRAGLLRGLCGNSSIYSIVRRVSGWANKHLIGRYQPW